MRVEHDKFGGATMRSILETKSIRRGTQSVLMFNECGSTSATRQMVLFALRLANQTNECIEGRPGTVSRLLMARSTFRIIIARIYSRWFLPTHVSYPHPVPPKPAKEVEKLVMPRIRPADPSSPAGAPASCACR